MSAKRLSRGAKALRGSYEAASHLREAIGEHNIEFSCPAERSTAHSVLWIRATLPHGTLGVNCNDLLRATPVMAGRNPSELPTEPVTPSLLKDCPCSQQCDCASTFHPIHNSPRRRAHSLPSVHPGPAITCIIFYYSRSPRHISEARAFSYRARVATATGSHRLSQTSLSCYSQGSGP